MDTTFFTALCIFEVESPPIGQINFPAAFTAACYTSATKHLATRRKFLDPRAQGSGTNGPGPWDQWIQGPRALGPVDLWTRALGPMDHGALGPGPNGTKGPGPSAPGLQNTHRVIFYSFSKEIHALQSQAGHVTEAFCHFYGAFLHISTTNCNVG